MSEGGKTGAAGSRRRVLDAFAHRAPDRTPLFETFWPHHPVHWNVCGRTPATDEEMAWNALADGISRRELVEMEAKTCFAMARHFGLDVVHIPRELPADVPRPVRTGPGRWTLDGTAYVLNGRTHLVVPEHPPQSWSDSAKISETDLIRQVESWDGSPSRPGPAPCPEVFGMVKAMAEAEGLDWVYMGEVGAGTGVAFYPPFQLMWLELQPELLRAWLAMVKADAFAETARQIAWGCEIMAMGGDVSCDKGPFCSPRRYRELILPVIREHVRLIHAAGALAVYTSDGNHWPIRDDFFFSSGVDGYLEVDRAAGMTMERLYEEGVDARVCIMGNIDARHTLCLGTADDVRREVRACLEAGMRTPGGHILHTSHSVHEDVKAENYGAMVDEYRIFFGLPRLDS